MTKVFTSRVAVGAYIVLDVVGTLLMFYIVLRGGA